MHRTRQTLLSALLNVTKIAAPRPAPSERTQLFGMGGTFGRGKIRHCSSWKFRGSDSADAETHSENASPECERRFSVEKLAEVKGPSFNDIFSR